MTKEKIKHSIIKYLDGKGFVFGGAIGRAIHDLTGAKEGIVERRCRELAQAGVLERSYEQVKGKGARVVLFRLPTVYKMKYYDNPDSLVKGIPTKQLTLKI